MIKVERAQRKQAKLRLAITGPSGSGKTMSALLIAFGIGPKVLLGDTEERSASLYADEIEGPLAGKSFDVAIIDPPYTIAKYIEVIDAAEQGGYDVLILDSISHAWAGEGGLLQKKEEMDSRGGATKNQYTNWAPITKEQEKFKARLLHCKVHLICTMRSKQDYILETNKDGKQVPHKVGMAPIQREGMEYEFTAVLDMAMDHSAMASKHRTGALLDDKVIRPTVKTGEDLKGWLTQGVAADADKPVGHVTNNMAVPATEDQISAITEKILTYQVLTSASDEAMSQAIIKRVHKDSGITISGVKDLTSSAADKLSVALDGWISRAKASATEKT